MEAVEATSDVHAFLDFLFEGLEGYVYLAAKVPGSDDPKDFQQKFYQYPQDAATIEAVIPKIAQTHEVYISPAIWSEPSARKPHFKATNVVWADFDGNAPTEWKDNNEPSLTINSSLPGHAHTYWRLTEPLTDPLQVEAINRAFVQNLQADNSGWDCTQVLRPPNTRNHKRQQAEVTFAHRSGISYDVQVFEHSLPSSAVADEEVNLQGLPDIQKLILKYAFTPDMVHLLTRDKDSIPDRSAAMMNLAYGSCEMGMSDDEVFALLLLADDRWGKFKKRDDRVKRLKQIVNVARAKYPLHAAENPEDEEQFTLAYDYLTFLNTEINIDWLIEGMLMEQGTMLMVGPSGVGKTTLSLQFMIHLALGKDFLHYKIEKPKKILFLSLEMDHGSLKIFLEQMNSVLSPEDRVRLADNFIIVPHGEPWALNTPVGQEYLINLLDAVQPDGLFIDSIGSSIKGSISNDEHVQPLLTFNDKIKKRYGLFTWYIHHMRKHQQGGNHASTQDDIYGNQYLLNRSTSSYGVLFGKNGTIKVRNFKNRLAPTENDYFLQRKDGLSFEKITKAEIAAGAALVKTTDNPDETAPNGFSI